MTKGFSRNKAKIVIGLLAICASCLGLAAKRVNSAESLAIESLTMGEILQRLVVQSTLELDREWVEAEAVTPSASPSPQTQTFAQTPTQVVGGGTKLSLNGRIVPLAWKQWQVGGVIRTGITDVGVQQLFGLELLSTRNWTRQPIQWFSNPLSTPLVLVAHHRDAYRYLDITEFAQQMGWQFQAQGDTLALTSVPARLESIRQETQLWGFRMILDLDRPTPWQVSRSPGEGVIILDAIANPSVIEQFTPPPAVEDEEDEGNNSTLNTQHSKLSQGGFSHIRVKQEMIVVKPAPTHSTLKTSPIEGDEKNNAAPENQPIIRVETNQTQTTIGVSIPDGLRLHVFSLPNPNRLVIELRPDAMVEKDILWAPGIWWRQRTVTLGDTRFPLVWLEVDPKNPQVNLKPIWSNPTNQMGTAPLIQTAQLWQASAAINGGFFNRNNQLPLGAIRRDGRWYSGPILNRGAIAWTDQHQFKFGRLSLQETLITAKGERFPILFLNSGYVQAGRSRYTPEWGAIYTPLTDNEVISVVQNNQITAQLPGGLAGKEPFPIPVNGYLLIDRGSDPKVAVSTLTIGTQVQIEQKTLPIEFNNYPHILGAGPLLLQNRQIVLDAQAEKFSDAFAQQAAIRSAIGITANGTIIIAAMHNRLGGRGPNLTETAQLMQQLGAVDALNLDGGSSTGLYLGGHLLDRSPYTAARVHNALGLFRPNFP
ncbi:phosphodiester glycosidase family protein [Coleofasciculus sp. G3-WIS-01]|uniref:phosphodiester glycosidase family protein n=1 Tax=Coleofasciculus sp. G3-WIS-01 TaxID=3069528 RepID=UPI0040635058